MRAMPMTFFREMALMQMQHIFLMGELQAPQMQGLQTILTLGLIRCRLP